MFNMVTHREGERGRNSIYLVFWLYSVKEARNDIFCWRYSVFSQNVWYPGQFWILDYFKMFNPFSHSPSSHHVPLPVMVVLLASEPQFLSFCPQSKDDMSFWEIKSHEGVLGACVKHQPFGRCCLYVHGKLWSVDKERDRREELGMLAYDPSSQEPGAGGLQFWGQPGQPRCLQVYSSKMFSFIN